MAEKHPDNLILNKNEQMEFNYSSSKRALNEDQEDENHSVAKRAAQSQLEISGARPKPLPGHKKL